MPKIGDCASTVTHSEMNKSTNCLKRVYITQLAWTPIDQIDTITDTDEEITAIAMSGGALFQPIDSYVENALFVSDYVDGIYTNTLTVDFRGMDLALRNAILDAQSLCDLVFWIGFSDCTYRIMGIDKVGTGASAQWTTLFRSELTGHNESKGGANDASNTVVFTSTSITSPPFTTLDFENLPTP